MTEREASRLDKFRQLLAGPNTDLGKACSSKQSSILSVCYQSWASIWCSLAPVPLFILSALFCYAFIIWLCFPSRSCFSYSICQLCSTFNHAASAQVIPPSVCSGYTGEGRYTTNGKCKWQSFVRREEHNLTNPRDCLPPTSLLISIFRTPFFSFWNPLLTTYFPSSLTSTWKNIRVLISAEFSSQWWLFYAKIKKTLKKSDVIVLPVKGNQPTGVTHQAVYILFFISICIQALNYLNEVIGLNCHHNPGSAVPLSPGKISLVGQPNLGRVPVVPDSFCFGKMETAGLLKASHAADFQILCLSVSVLLTFISCPPPPHWCCQILYSGRLHADLTRAEAVKN